MQRQNSGHPLASEQVVAGMALICAATSSKGLEAGGGGAVLPRPSTRPPDSLAGLLGLGADQLEDDRLGPLELWWCLA